MYGKNLGDAHGHSDSDDGECVQLEPERVRAKDGDNDVNDHKDGEDEKVRKRERGG